MPTYNDTDDINDNIDIDSEPVKNKPVRLTPATHEEVMRAIRQYIDMKEPFTYEVQNDTISVKCHWGSFTNLTKDYSIEELNFIKRVKQYIVKNGLYKPFLEAKPPKPVYNKFGNLKEGTTFEKVANIDLSSAYWETANMLGLLSPEIYEQGKTIRKKVRLAAIGSLAKKKRIYTFDGTGERLKEEIRSLQTEKIWDAICHHVGTVLVKAAKQAGPDFIFFWVDGIYLKKGPAEAVVKRVFKQAGYEFKMNAYKSITVTDRNILVNLFEPEPRMVDGVQVMKTYKPFPYRAKKRNEKKKI